MATGEPDWVPAGVDTNRANVARVYDYLVGGTHNFLADQDVGRAIIAVEPNARAIGQANRGFLGRAVRFLAAAGIRQFIDVGSGIPTAGNVHEVAQQAAPDARVVYADIDPVAIAHSKAILAGNPRATVIEADLRAPETVLARVADTGLIDFTQPVALLLIAVVHFVQDEEDPWRIVGGLMDALAPGSYLAVTHGTLEGKPDVAHAAEKVYQRAVAADLRMRPRADILRLFDGLELIEPGLVAMPQWQPESPADRPEDRGKYWGGLAGVGYKPAELSARRPLQQDIRAVGPRRDRRVGVGVGHHVEERHRLRRQRLLQGRADVGGAGDPVAGRADGAGDRRVVNRLEVDRRRVRAEVVQLGVLLKAENRVVEHDDRDREPLTDRRLQLDPDVAEPAVAGDADDRRVRARGLGAQRQRQSPAESGQSPR
jgi:hypothetical protein